MKKTTLFMILALVLSMAIGLTGTLAYLTDTDKDVNVMTLGNVDIEQIELERVEQKNESTDLQDFSQNKPLYPAVGEAGWSPENQKWPDVTNTADSPLFDAEKLTNVQDKFVFVENTGKSDAYVRTIFAFEIGSFDPSIVRDDLIHLNKNDITESETGKGHWSWTWLDEAVEIDGSHYAIAEAIYLHKSSVQNTPEEGILPVGFTSYPSLLQVYLDPRATNEDCEALDGNGNGTYDILVVSQAVQAMGFDDAETALDEAFGDVTDKCHPWMKEEDGGQPPYADPPAYPVTTEYEGVQYVTTGDTVTVSPIDGDTLYRYIISDDTTNASNIVIREGIVRLNDRSICKASTITSVTLPQSLTYIDESAFQQSSITELEIPENVTYIGPMAMGACTELETIVIKAKDVTMGNYVARACPKLKSVYIHSDSIAFETVGMFFTNKESGDASGITFYVSSQSVADTLYNAATLSHGYGLLIKSLDGATTYYDTLK